MIALLDEEDGRHRDAKELEKRLNSEYNIVLPRDCDLTSSVCAEILNERKGKNRSEQIRKKIIEWIQKTQVNSVSKEDVLQAYTDIYLIHKERNRPPNMIDSITILFARRRQRRILTFDRGFANIPGIRIFEEIFDL